MCSCPDFKRMSNVNKLQPPNTPVPELCFHKASFQASVYLLFLDFQSYGFLKSKLFPANNAGCQSPKL